MVTGGRLFHSTYRLGTNLGLMISSSVLRFYYRMVYQYNTHNFANTAEETSALRKLVTRLKMKFFQN